MRLAALIVSFIILVASVCGFVALVRKHYPQPSTQTVHVAVPHNLAKMEIRRVPIFEEKPDGTFTRRYVTKTIPISETVVRFESKEREVPVTENDTLHFYFITICGCFFLAYAVIILLAFALALAFPTWLGKRLSTIEIHLTAVIAFTIGVSTNYFAIILSRSSDTELKQVKDELATIRDVISGRSFRDDYRPPDDIDFLPPDVEPSPDPDKAPPPTPAPAPNDLFPPLPLPTVPQDETQLPTNPEPQPAVEPDSQPPTDTDSEPTQNRVVPSEETT